MGIYDRDYYREEQRPGFSLRAPRTITVTLILINVVLYLANALFSPERNTLTDVLTAHDYTLKTPLLWWQLLTYGFVHDQWPGHIFMNMLQLWFLGRAVEEVYGRREFLRIYLVMLVVGSLVWAITNQLSGSQCPGVLGASGAVSGVVFLFILNYPRVTLRLFPIPIPVKAWVIGALLVVGNLAGALSQFGTTAFGVHLAGIGFAYVYFRQRWNLGGAVEGLSLRRLKRRPRLRVHNPADKDRQLTKEVDRILEKIHREGESSLTRKERRTLESASREYQQRRGE